MMVFIDMHKHNGSCQPQVDDIIEKPIVYIR